MDSQEKIKYLREMNTERDIRNQMQYQYDMGLEDGIGKGIEIGFGQGAEKEAMRMAGRMKADGVDIYLIVKYTGLNQEQIESL